MSITLGDLVWWIRGKTDKLPEDLDKSKQQVEGWGKKVSETFKDQMNIAVGVFMSQGMMQLSGALQGFTDDLINTTVEYSNQMQDLALITGMTLEDTSRLYNVADDLRVGYSDLTTGMRIYADYLDRTNSTENLTIESLARLSDEFLKLAPGVEQTAFLIERFGARSGTEMGKLLAIGSQAILDMAGALDENLIVTEETVKVTEEYRLALDEWEDSIQGLKIALGQEFLPYLTQFTGWMTSNGIPALQGFIDWFKQLPAPVQSASIGLLGVLAALTAMAPMILSISTLIGPLIGMITGIPAFLTGTLFPALTTIGTGIVSFLVTPVGVLVLAITGLILVIGSLGREAWTAMKQLYDIMMTTLIRIAHNLGMRGVEAGLNIVYGIGKGIRSGVGWLVDIIIDFSETIVDAIKKTLKIESPSEVFAVEVGKPSVEGIGKGFRDNLGKVIMEMQAGVQLMPAGAMAGGMGGSVSVGHVEYHGSFSDEERNWFDKRSKDNTGKVIRRAIR